MESDITVPTLKNLEAINPISNVNENNINWEIKKIRRIFVIIAPIGGNSTWLCLFA